MAKLRLPDLTYRPSRPPPISTLLAKLRDLSGTLRPIEQDDPNRPSPAELATLGKQLSQNAILSHKDAGVRAWAMACVVDVFRVAAPDAPFQRSELKNIFSILVDELLPRLAEPADVYNEQHMYVLKLLAEVRSVVLMTDLDDGADLVVRTFSACFDVLATPRAEGGEGLSKNVEHHMTVILQTLVEEIDGAVPAEVVDIVLAQFLRADPTVFSSGKRRPIEPGQSTLVAMREAPPAYQMARNVCNGQPARMARGVGSYFAALALDLQSSAGLRNSNGSSTGRHDGHDSHDSDEAAAAMAEMGKAHRLVRELWRSVPDVLVEVVPQLEQELATDRLDVRLLAAETVGDMLAGVGAAGPPPVRPLDPAVYPSSFGKSALSGASGSGASGYDFLTTPTSQYAFATHHPSTYAAFLSRKNDRQPTVRAACVAGAAVVISTRAGGVGLDRAEEQRLVDVISHGLVDSDERVRIAAVVGIGRIDMGELVRIFGDESDEADGPVGWTSDGVFSRLADRMKDRKPTVRAAAIVLLGRIWGVAADAIGAGDRLARAVFGPIASRLLETYYLNEPEVKALVDKAIHQSLVPLTYPRARKGVSDSDRDSIKMDADRLRARRVLVLISCLGDRACKVVMLQAVQQASVAKVVTNLAEVADKLATADAGQAKMLQQQADRLIGALASKLPDPVRGAADLTSFVACKDRRAYVLVRFACDGGSEHSRVAKSIGELRKRLSGKNDTVWEAVELVLFHATMLLFSRSHLPTILAQARDGTSPLAAAAHEVVRVVATHCPDVVRAHAAELGQAVMSGRDVDQADDQMEDVKPTSPTDPTPTALPDDLFALQACAAFARKFPADLPSDPRFNSTLAGFISGARSGPLPGKAAKWAAVVQLSTAATDDRDRTARRIVRQTISFFDSKLDSVDGAPLNVSSRECRAWVSNLAAASKVVLVAGSAIGADDNDRLAEIATAVLVARFESDSSGHPDDLSVGGPTEAKVWSLRMLVNQVRGAAGPSSTPADPSTVLALLDRLVAGSGNRSMCIPTDDQPAVRLEAAKLTLKLARLAVTGKGSGPSPESVVRLGTVAQDPNVVVRERFVNTLVTRLGRNWLPVDYHGLLGLAAFEPFSRIKDVAVKWLRSRVSGPADSDAFPVDAVFARLVSVLAHHPDFEPDEVESMADTARYLLFAVTAIGTESTVNQLFHAAQRIKTVGDAVDSKTTSLDDAVSSSKSLYIVADLAQVVVRAYQAAKGWQGIQTLGSRAVRFPVGLFRPIQPVVGRENANKWYVDDTVVEIVEGIVKSGMRRRRDDGIGSVKVVEGGPKTKTKTKTKKRVRRMSVESVRRVKKKEGEVVTPLRRSSRKVKPVGYAEESGEDEEEEEEEGEEEDEDGDDDGDGDDGESDDDSTRSLTPIEDGNQDEEDDQAEHVDKMDVDELDEKTPRSSRRRSARLRS